MNSTPRAKRDHPPGTLLKLSRVRHGKEDFNAIDVTSTVRALHAPAQKANALNQAARRFMAAAGGRRGCAFRALERAIAELLVARPTTTKTLALAVRHIEGPIANGVVPGEPIVVAQQEDEEEEQVTTAAECERVAGRGLYTLVDVDRPGTMLATFTGEAVVDEKEEEDDTTYYVTAGETAACPKYGLPGGGDNATNGECFMCANEPNPGETPNAAIVEVAVREDVAVFGIMATAPISKGREVTVDYGNCDSWPHRKNNKNNNKRKKYDGDRDEEVDVCYDGEWYRAKITARVVSGETVTVQYTGDGMHESRVVPERIRRLEVA